MEVEEVSEPYYYALWNSFSNTEKFLLYDLAKDKFVNIRNLKIMRVLLQKGIVVLEDSLQIMNESFNNFILYAVKEDEELRMEQQLRKQGNWSTIQMVLIVILLGLGTFIAIAQQKLFHNISALITALGGVSALLLRFGGLFNTTSRKD
jgi:hypothetical protein